MAKRNNPSSALLPTPPLLITESEDEFGEICDAFRKEIEPKGIVERMYCDDVAYLTWEILRLRRCKVDIVNTEFRAALANLLTRQLREPGLYDVDEKYEADRLAYAWFTDKDVKKNVAELLGQFQLDESAIASQAMRSLIEDLEKFERLIASAEARRERTLRSIVDYRSDFAERLRKGSNRIIDGKILALEHTAAKKSSAA
jgi:hypothetical protein